MIDILDSWKIGVSKVMKAVTDNASNMISAFRNGNENEEIEDEMVLDQSDEESSEDIENSGSEDGDDVASSNMERIDNEFDLVQEEHRSTWMSRHVRCMVHSLQLVIRKIEKEERKSSRSVIRAAVRLINSFRKSAALTTQLRETSNGRVLRGHNLTRWSSLYRAIERLSQLEKETKEVCANNRIDGLLESQWATLNQIRQLLEPFADHTLSSESNSSVTISMVIPAIKDLKCHLERVSCFSFIHRSSIAHLVL